MKKRVFAYLLSLLMMISSCIGAVSPFILTVSAEESETLGGFASGTGSRDDPYIISNIDEMLHFKNLMIEGVTFKGIYLSLANDIDISAVTWNISDTVFEGSFYGNGNTITTKSRFFYEIGESGDVLLLNVKVPDTESLYKEILCYSNKGTIEGCMIFGSIGLSKESVGGFICSDNSGTIANCAAIGDLSGDNVHAAGMVYRNNGVLSNVYSAVEIDVDSVGRYGYCSEDGVARTYGNECEVKNVYCIASTTRGNRVSDDYIKTLEFTTSLNETNTCMRTSWSYTEGEYPRPIADLRSAVTCRLAVSDEDMITYGSSELTSEILTTSENALDIYYTLDGSDPTKSESAILYDGSVSLSGSGVIRMVVSENGLFGAITNQYYVQIRGEGSEQTPYLIGNKYELYIIQLDPDAYYLLECDIVFDESDFGPGGFCQGGWTPIETFNGVLNGNGHAIVNIKGTNGGFITQNNGTVRLLRFLNSGLSLSSSVVDAVPFGTVADKNAGRVEYCYVEANITVYGNCAGGIVGENYPGTVAYCSTDGIIKIVGPKSSYNRVTIGGIVGYGSNVSGCYNRMDLTYYYSGETAIEILMGGIAGGGDVSNCRSDSDLYISLNQYSIDSDGEVSYGAFVGYQYGGNATNCYGSYTYSGYEGGLYHKLTDLTEKSKMSYVSNSIAIKDRWKESLFSELDFNEKWMIVNGEPVPQRCMNADGSVFAKVSYFEGEADDGGYIGRSEYINQYGMTYSEIFPHECKFDRTKLLSDESGHYYACYCGETDGFEVHIKDENDPDCVDSECVKCGYAMLASASHTEMIDEAVSPTCTETGLTEGTHCSMCGKILTAQKVVDETGHSYGDWESIGFDQHKRSCACGEEEISSHEFGDQSVCERCNMKKAVMGDVNGGENVDKDDAIYLLMYTFFPESYPLNQNADFNGDGKVTKDDAIYLLMYTFFPDFYPMLN